jgi:hypothetical protein
MSKALNLAPVTSAATLLMAAVPMLALAVVAFASGLGLA